MWVLCSQSLLRAISLLRWAKDHNCDCFLESSSWSFWNQRCNSTRQLPVSDAHITAYLQSEYRMPSTLGINYYKPRDVVRSVIVNSKIGSSSAICYNSNQDHQEEMDCMSCHACWNGVAGLLSLLQEGRLYKYTPSAFAGRCTLSIQHRYAILQIKNSLLSCMLQEKWKCRR